MPERARDLTVTMLADNLVGSGEGVLAEHGLCMLVESDNRHLLFDVGQSGIFLGNAARLGIDLALARKVVLSHGHYDHTGGLPLLLAAFGPREIIAHPDVFTPKYARRRGRKPREIGLGHGPHDLMRRGAVLSLESGSQELLRGVFTTGPIARSTDFEVIPSHFAVEVNGHTQKDQFEEEQAIIVNTRRGLVVLVGCSHRGVVNTLRHAMQLTGVERIHAVIGGTHLGPADEHQIGRTIEEFRRLDIARVVACHCTGFRASARLAAELGDVFDPGGVGYRFDL